MAFDCVQWEESLRPELDEIIVKLNMIKKSDDRALIEEEFKRQKVLLPYEEIVIKKRKAYKKCMNKCDKKNKKKPNPDKLERCQNKCMPKSTKLKSPIELAI